MQRIIYTIGHSTRSFDEFVSLLKVFSIEMIADVRSYPGSRRYPHFNKENLSKLLAAANINYQHIPLLGGRRKTSLQSKNKAWKNDAFRGYADYMETADFTKGIKELTTIAEKCLTAFMCSEAVWWRCHRSMIADYLKANGWQVSHIINDKRAEEHPFTAPAKIIDGKLSYTSSQQNIF